MNHKTIAVAVALSAGVGLAFQDFGVPPGVPNVFVGGEVAVADDVNENFDWVEDEITDLRISDNAVDIQLALLDEALRERSQSFAALGYFSSGDCFPGGGPLLQDEMAAGCPSFRGWLDIPVPQDWDKASDMTVTFSVNNYVDIFGGQLGETFNFEVYGKLISGGENAVGDSFCDPGPGSSDFSDSFQLTVPTVQPEVPTPFGELHKGKVSYSIPSGYPHPVTASFTISPQSGDPLLGGFGPWDNPQMMRVVFYAESVPVFAGGGGGGGGYEPCLYSDGSLSPEDTIEQFFAPPSFVQLSYLTE
ncbi:MAG: hypothetical protein MK291_04785 [Planctomycetes bacterium]|nr:hypothetical protein [Planctomycetota bacterium]